MQSVRSISPHHRLRPERAATPIQVSLLRSRRTKEEDTRKEPQMKELAKWKGSTGRAGQVRLLVNWRYEGMVGYTVVSPDQDRGHGGVCKEGLIEVVGQADDAIRPAITLERYTSKERQELIRRVREGRASQLSQRRAPQRRATRKKKSPALPPKAQTLKQAINDLTPQQLKLLRKELGLGG